MKQVVSEPEQVTYERPALPALRAEDESRPFAWERVLGRVRLLWSRRRFLFRVACAGLLFATIVAFLIPASYESTAQLMPPDSSSDNIFALLAGLGGQGSSASGSALGGLASDLLGIRSTGALFIGVLESRTVQDRIIDELNLRHVYHVRWQAQAERKLSERTEISEDRKSGIITLTVTDHNAKRASEIAGGYVDALNGMMADLSTSSAHRERVFLEGRLNSISKELEAAEQDFSQFSSKNTAIDVSAQAKAMLESSAMLQGQLVAAQSELEGLRQIFTENNVRVRSTEARIHELKEQIQKMAGPSGTQAQPADETSNADDPYPAARQLPILGVGYADHLRRVKVDEAVFETLTKEYELAKVQEAKEIPTVKVLDRPNVPERKSFPPRALIMLFGTIFMAILGVVWVVGSASWNEADPQDPRKAFATEILHKLEARYPWMSNGLNGNGRGHDSKNDERSCE